MWQSSLSYISLSGVKKIFSIEMPHTTLKKKKLTPKRLLKKANPILSHLSIPISNSLNQTLTAHNAEVKSFRLSPIFQCLCEYACVDLRLCVSVSDAFGDKDPCCRESCGKGVRPEDVSAPASDNVSLRDMACHFTQPHIKKDRGGTEETTACHLFALIQDRTKGGTGSLWVCVCVCVSLTYVCMACM